MTENNLPNLNDIQHHIRLVKSPDKQYLHDVDPLFSTLTSTSTFTVFPSENIPVGHFSPVISPDSCCSLANNYTRSLLDHQSYKQHPSVQHTPKAGSSTKVTSIPPSSFSPTIDRKSSITPKYVKDDTVTNRIPESLALYPSSSQIYQQSTNSISINKQVDQASNTYLVNFNSIPELSLTNDVKYFPQNNAASIQQQQPQPLKEHKTDQETNLINFEAKDSNNISSKTSQSAITSDLYSQTDQNQLSVFSHSPTTQSLKLNLSNQSCDNEQFFANNNKNINNNNPIIFNSNNPFLNDNFGTSIDETKYGNEAVNFFNVDDIEDGEEYTTKDEDEYLNTGQDGIEHQLLKYKREKFSNASSMKICLVVSPPTNKLFQLKSKSLTHLDRLQPQINIQSNYDKENLKDINGSCNVPNAKNNTLMASATPATTVKKVNISKLTSNLDFSCTPTPIPTPTATIATPPPPLPLSSSVVATAQIKKKTSSFLHRDYNRKPILARSQVSSSEYFSVCFTENGFKDKDEIFIAASKGISLGDSLRQAMVQRNLNFDHICVIDYGLNNSNELGIPQYFGPLEPNTDISILAGHSLFVTERESSNKKSGHYVLQKAASVGYRTRHGKLFTSVSTEDNIESNETTIKNLLTSKQPSKQRWSLQLFGVKNPQQNQLCELLNNFMKNGVPKSNASHIINFEYSDALETLDGLPQSWNDFINASEMTDTDSKIQSAIWELVTTEVDYIYAIQTVTDLFLACLEAIQSENLLCDVDQHKLFSNIRDICDANLKLWSLYFYPMVKHSIATGHPMCIDYFGQGFTNFSSIFEPYTKYCAEQSTCQFYCKELNRSNSLFTAYLAWCEAQKECNRLRLADILVRPMQRLTKYNLLLSAIRKNISEETDSEIMDAMIHSVEDFVCSVNAHLTTRQENERLKGIMARIDAYDVVDSNNEHLEKVIRQYSVMFDLCAPMKGCLTSQGRYLFLEGDMKYKDNISKSDVHCFLLTDIFLVCKQTAKKVHSNLKVIRQPFMTDRIVVQLKEKDNTLHCVYLNEFNMVIAGFTLQCNEAKNWYEGFVKAKHIYTRLKQGSPFMDSIKFPSTNAHSNMSHTNQNHTAISSSNNINVIDNTSIKKSPLGSSIGSRVSSLNNSHSGSVELTESKAVSVDFEKTNSISSDEGSSYMKLGFNNAGARKLRQTSANSLTVQPFSNHLGQSMPNLCGHIANNPYINNNTLLVPGSTKSHSAHSSHSGNLLSPSHRGISYPPPSPTRATLRRGFAFSSSIKNPPLIKTRNITSQSFNCNQQQQQQQNLIIGATNQSQTTSVQVAIELQPDNATINGPEENCTDT